MGFISAPRAAHALIMMCGGLAALTGCGAEEAEQAATPPPAPAAAPVRVAEARGGTLVDHRVYLGQVQPLSAVTLAPAVAGTVKEVNGRPGDQVKQGQILLRLDTDLIKPDIAAARATEAEIETDLAQAKRDLTRARKRAHPIVTDVERERYQATVDRLAARLDGARAARRRLSAQLDRHTLTAPFDGVIRQRLVEPGAWVAAGAAAFALVSGDEVEILVEVAPTMPVTPGAEVELFDGERAAKAQIAGVVPALESATRARRLRLLPVGERPEWLLPGMAVSVRFAVTLGTAGGAGVILPRDALVRGPTGVRVMKVVDGKGVAVPVEIIASAKREALLKVPDGLTPPSAPALPGQESGPPPPPLTLKIGDQIVIRGNERLRPGQPVRVQTAAEEPAQ